MNALRIFQWLTWYIFISLSLNSQLAIIDRGLVDACTPVWELLEAEGFSLAAKYIHTAYLEQTLELSQPTTVFPQFTSESDEPLLPPAHKDLLMRILEERFDMPNTDKPYKELQLIRDMFLYANRMQDETGKEGQKHYVILLLESRRFSQLLRKVLEAQSPHPDYDAGKQFLLQVIFQSPFFPQATCQGDWADTLEQIRKDKGRNSEGTRNRQRSRAHCGTSFVR